MVVHQSIHYDMRSRSTVKNIAYDMQMIHNHPLDQIAKRNDKILRTPDPDDRMDDLIIIAFLILHFRLLCDQFFNDISKILWQRFSYFGSRIFGSGTLCDLYQTVQRDLIPIIDIFFFLRNQRQLLLRIIDQCRQRFLITLPQRIAKLFIDLTFNSAGTIFQHMVKLFIFSMDVRQEMLRPMGKI